MEFKPYKINETLESSYYQIPKELFESPIYQTKVSIEGKVLYGFLLSRMRLSVKNNWIDKEGNVFLIYKRADVQKMLNLSDKTVTKAFKQLAETKLIYEKHQGRNKPNLIYIGKIEHIPLKNNELNRKKYDSVVGNNTNPESENLRPIYKDINKKEKDKYNTTYFPKFDNRYIDDTGQYNDLSCYYANLEDD